MESFDALDREIRTRHISTGWLAPAILGLLMNGGNAIAQILPKQSLREQQPKPARRSRPSQSPRAVARKACRTRPWPSPC